MAEEIDGLEETQSYAIVMVDIDVFWRIWADAVSAGTMQPGVDRLVPRGPLLNRTSRMLSAAMAIAVALLTTGCCIASAFLYSH